MCTNVAAVGNKDKYIYPYKLIVDTNAAVGFKVKYIYQFKQIQLIDDETNVDEGFKVKYIQINAIDC